MTGADMLKAALARSDLPPTLRAFLLDVQRQAARRPLSPRQVRAVERIAAAPPRPDFAAVNRAALARLPDVLARLLPGGRAVGAEWHAGSLRGEAGNSLRVRLRGDRAGAVVRLRHRRQGGRPGEPRRRGGPRAAGAKPPADWRGCSGWRALTMAADGMGRDPFAPLDGAERRRRPPPPPRPATDGRRSCPRRTRCRTCCATAATARPRRPGTTATRTARCCSRCAASIRRARRKEILPLLLRRRMAGGGRRRPSRARSTGWTGSPPARPRRCWWWRARRPPTPRWASSPTSCR